MLCFGASASPRNVKQNVGGVVFSCIVFNIC